jgi:hypothetical protein
VAVFKLGATASPSNASEVASQRRNPAAKSVVHASFAPKGKKQTQANVPKESPTAKATGTDDWHSF